MNDQKDCKPASEIFRHLRSHWFDHKTHRLIPNTHGGISFLLRPSAQGKYDFWIYMCPNDIVFSARQAVKSLREAVARETVPFGTIELTDEPILDLLTRFIVDERMVLPSEASKQMLAITIINGWAKKKMEQAQQKAVGAKKEYEEN